MLTKPDLIGPGGEDEVVAVLQGLRKPLKLGYVMVKNRSQQQINDRMSLADAALEEARWFRQHEKFGALDNSFFGVQQLSSRLTQVLVDRIQASKPHLSKEVESLLALSTSELKGLSAAPPSGPVSRPSSLQDLHQARSEQRFLRQAEVRAMLIKTVQRIVELVRQATDGNYTDELFNRMPVSPPNCCRSISLPAALRESPPRNVRRPSDQTSGRCCHGSNSASSPGSERQWTARTNCSGSGCVSSARPRKASGAWLGCRSGSARCAGGSCLGSPNPKPSACSSRSSVRDLRMLHLCALTPLGVHSDPAVCRAAAGKWAGPALQLLAEVKTLTLEVCEKIIAQHVAQFRPLAGKFNQILHKV